MKKVILLLLFSTILSLAKELPTEGSLVQGKLENGFEYTILHNPKPKNRAELKLLVKVGSIDEEDDQQGVAHFIEHMAFNGSRHFKKNELITYLESVGVKFGNDLNANTGFEKTVYMLTIPLEKDNLQKSFLVFSDWAEGLNFDPKEFDKERGVVLEEERLGDTMRLRIFHQYNDLVYKNSPYLNREPIGKKEIIKTIPLKRAKDFYSKWYRPELMHFIAVGDFNTTKIEGLIKKTFSKLKNRNHIKTKPRVIPENNTTRIRTVWDEEVTSNQLSVFYMDELYSVRTEDKLRESIKENIVTKLFNEQADRQIEKSNPKATMIKLRSSKLNSNRGYYEFIAGYKGEDELPALKELYQIIWSLKEYGFSKEALNRVKEALLSENEKAYQRVYDQKSSSLSTQLLKSVFANAIFVDYKTKYRLKKKLIKNITLKEVNQLFKKIVNFQDRVILFYNNSGRKYSTEQVLSTIDKAKKESKNLTKEKRLPKDLIIDTLKRKKITATNYNKATDIHEFTLENGIRVAFKKSDFTKDRVLLKGFSFGGKSLYDADKLLSVARTTLFVSSSGVGEFSMLDLEKILSNTNLSLYALIQARTEEINGKSNIHDIENMFALLYLKITQAKIDKNITRNIKNILKNRAKKALNNPKEKFYREEQKYYYENNPRIQFETPEAIEAFDEEEMLKIYNDRFSDLNNFVFMIVGDISLEKIEALSQKYLGNLPVLKRKERLIKRDLPHLKGHVTFAKNYNHENISYIRLAYKSKIPYTQKSELISNALEQILTIRLRKLIREDKSAVYSIRASISLDMLEVKSTGEVSFACDPKRKDELLKMIYALIKEIKTKPVTQEELHVFKKGFATHHETSLKENSYWINTMERFYKKEIPLEDIYKQTTFANQITAKDILEFANKVFAKDSILMELNPME